MAAICFSTAAIGYNTDRRPSQEGKLSPYVRRIGADTVGSHDVIACIIDRRTSDGSGGDPSVAAATMVGMTKRG